MIRRSYERVEDSGSSGSSFRSTSVGSTTTTSATTTTTTNGNSTNGHNIAATRALPGRAKRRQRRYTSHASQATTNKLTFWTSLPSRLYTWVIVGGRGGGGVPLSAYSSLCIAVLLWYCLGVVGITTSKLLLRDHNTPPMFLTFQQFAIGSCLLRFLLQIKFMKSQGLQPIGSLRYFWKLLVNPKSSTPINYSHTSSTVSSIFLPPPSIPNQKRERFPSHLKHLFLSGIFFSLGFLTTNSAFHGSSTAFVETVKAAEPITSALVAVIAGIETLSPPEIISLGSIVLGVMLSTLSHSSSSSTTTLNAAAGIDDADATASKIHSTILSFSQSLQICCIVMIANLCFSFRGLYQKRYRASPEGNAQVMDDLNIQFRMQQIGVLLLIFPVIVWDIPTILLRVWRLFSGDANRMLEQQQQQHNNNHHYHVGISSDLGMQFQSSNSNIDGSNSLDNNSNSSGLVFRYIFLALLNGVAFTSYNLASTYILSRISVVHHAALNCIRRIFAIIVTSIIFLTPITFTGIIGFITSFAGFMSLTHFKLQKQKAKPRPSYTSLLPMTEAELLEEDP